MGGPSPPWYTSVLSVAGTGRALLPLRGATPMALESRKTKRVCLGGLGYAAIAVVGLIVVLVMVGRDGGPDRPRVVVPSAVPYAGDLGTLRLPGGGGEVWLAT